MWHGLLIYFIVRRLTRFRWSAANRRMGFFFLSLITGVFCAFCSLPFWAASSFGVVATLASGVYSVRTLLHLTSLERIPPPLRKLLVRLRVAPPDVLG